MHQLPFFALEKPGTFRATTRTSVGRQSYWVFVQTRGFVIEFRGYWNRGRPNFLEFGTRKSLSDWIMELGGGFLFSTGCSYPIPALCFVFC